MKKLILSTLLLLLYLNLSASQTFSSIDFNFGWKFSLSADNNAYKTKYNVDKWSNVRLPHDWSIELGYTREKTAGSNGYLPGGIGWYRKNFTLPKDSKGKKIFIRFEGVYEQSKVWINGHFLGFRPNGYVGFEYDITPYLNKKENVLAVRVDRTEYADARWYVGGGIYRNVHLDIRNSDYIPTNGVFVTTPIITDSAATIKIATDLFCGTENRVKSLKVKQQICIGENVVAEMVKPVSFKIGKSTIQETMIVKNPMLWTLEQPNVYTLKTSLINGDDVLDVKNTTFGVRTIKFDANRGFLVNGKSEKIKGVNIHHDMGCVGVALYDAVLYRRLLSLKKMGCNAIRTSHNPHSESLLNMCDTMGLVVMDEFFDDWKVVKGKWITKRGDDDAPKEITIGYNRYFNDWAERDMKETIVRDRNHPSVVLWSIGNEIEWTYPYYWASTKNNDGFGGLIFTGNPDSDRKALKKRFDTLSKGHDELAETARTLAKWVKEVDVTRPVTAGVVIPPASRVSGYTDALDVVGYNYKDMYYTEDHKEYPNQCILGSENVGQYYEWKAVMDRDYIPGIFVWTGIDYIGENGPWPLKGALYSFFDFACFKTPRGHFFECLWNNTPKTYMVTTPAEESEFKLKKNGEFVTELRKSPLRRWEWFTTYNKWKYKNNEPIIVQVYTNAPQVELFLNGKSLGVKNRTDFPQQNIIPWEVSYQDGELVAVGMVNGREVSRYSLKTNSSPTGIIVNADKNVVKADKYDVAHLEISLVDDNGVAVVDDEKEIEVIVDNNIRILGVDNGSATFVGSHKTNKIITHNGKCLFILQSKDGKPSDSQIVIKMSGKEVKKYNLKFI